MHTLNVEKSRWTAREISLTAAMTAVVFLLTCWRILWEDFPCG